MRPPPPPLTRLELARCCPWTSRPPLLSGPHPDMCLIYWYLPTAVEVEKSPMDRLTSKLPKITPLGTYIVKMSSSTVGVISSTENPTKNLRPDRHSLFKSTLVIRKNDNPLMLYKIRRHSHRSKPGWRVRYKVAGLIRFCWRSKRKSTASNRYAEGHLEQARMGKAEHSKNVVWK